MRKRDSDKLGSLPGGDSTERQSACKWPFAEVANGAFVGRASRQSRAGRGAGPAEPATSAAIPRLLRADARGPTAVLTPGRRLSGLRGGLVPWQLSAKALNTTYHALVGLARIGLSLEDRSALAGSRSEPGEVLRGRSGEGACRWGDSQLPARRPGGHQAYVCHAHLAHTAWPGSRRRNRKGRAPSRRP
jgi:hypothetical protein